MTWNKREPVTNLVVLGDEDGHKKKVSGLLIGCPKDRMYPEKTNYEIVQQDGEVLVLSGSASLRNQIGDADVGHFLKCEFKGWGKSPNGKYKDIEVNVWEGEPNDAMKKWPRFGEFNGARKATAAAKRTEPDADEFDDVTKQLADADDELPF